MGLFKAIYVKISRLRRKRQLYLPFYRYALIFSCAGEEEREEQYSAIKNLPRPVSVCGKETPKNLNMISYGQLDDLHDNSAGLLAIVNCCKVILGVSEEDIMKESAERVLWFVYFCNKEVERINKLFEAIKPHFDSEEKQAGVDRLKFGSFGILDWYARRMRITDQNEVRNVPWIRIYKCMKNDNELREYDRRLREVYKRKSNR